MLGILSATVANSPNKRMASRVLTCILPSGHRLLVTHSTWETKHLQGRTTVCIYLISSHKILLMASRVLAFNTWVLNGTPVLDMIICLLVCSLSAAATKINPILLSLMASLDNKWKQTAVFKGLVTLDKNSDKFSFTGRTLSATIWNALPVEWLSIQPWFFNTIS